MDKFCYFLTDLYASSTSVFSIPGDNLSNYQWIFTKLGVCIDIVEAWFGVAERQISSILTIIPAPYTSILSFLNDNSSIYQWIFTKLGMCIDIVEICVGIANGQISSIFLTDICPKRDNGGVLSFHVLLLISLSLYK